MTGSMDDAPSGAPPSPIDLRERLPEILAEWKRLVEDEPWHAVPDVADGDPFTEAIDAVLHVATWSGAGRAAHERLVRAASAHGEQRREQRDGGALLLREYHGLRTAVWRHLRGATLARPDVLVAMLRIDVATDVATTIAMRALHRDWHASAASWELDLLQQVQASSRHLVDRLGGRGTP